MIKIVPDKFKIPDIQRRNILSGYFSIILILIGIILLPIFNGYLNLSGQILLAVIALIPGFILFIYFFIGFIRIMIDLIKNPNSIKNKSTLRTHYLLIWILNIIWILFGHFFYKLDLSGLVAPIIFILLLIKFMK
jgi:hypothetical protein